MNYLIWNGVNSNTITGLLISELPPITKPKMRTKITNIDGRDGDIVDELGYESYTKRVNIGLTRNFDIDEVIKYFTGTGEIIFSNEPDKYYKATIIDNIDYERLLRFKTATIEFHVQPFKYKVNEQIIDVTIGSETSITITNNGLEKSKPIITLYGDEEVTIALNGNDVFSINIDNDEVTIDSIKEEAYKGNVLKNRSMSGEFMLLDPGENVITWTGSLTRIKIDPKSRWL